MKRLMTLQWYIYDQRLPRSRSHKAVTDSKDSKVTVVSAHCSTTSDEGQTGWTVDEMFGITGNNAKIHSEHDSLFCV